MKKSLLAISALLTAILLHGCKTGGSFSKAEEAFAKEQYYEAIDLYKSAYSGTRDKTERASIAFKVAESYLLAHDYNRSEGWYQKAMNMGYPDPVVYKRLGEVQKMSEKYEEALLAYETYAKEMPSDKSAEEHIALIKAVLNPGEEFCEKFVVEPFKAANSAYHDYSPAILERKGMYFTSDREEATGKKQFGRTGGYYTDIFMVQKERRGRGAERWGTPTLLEGEVNTDYNEGAPAFDKRGSMMYFTQCNGVKGDKPNCVIMVARRKGQGYGTPEILPFCTDTTIDYGQPSLSPDGDKLLFVMDGPHGYGKHDIYMSTYVRRSRTWDDPINLGPLINTDGAEMSPYWYNDTTVYFASNGHPGNGGLDIFMTTGSGTKWSKPKHFGVPLNSGADDYGIVFDEEGQNGYFTSNRIRSRLDDIYSFTVVPMIYTISGVVRNSKTGSLMEGATVTLVNTRTNKTMTATTDETGSYQFKLDEATPYTIMASKRAYYNSTTYYPTTVGLECSKDMTQDLEVTPNDVVIELQGIYYDLDKATLRPESKTILDSLVGIMNTYPYIVVELGSHTDCRASLTYNDSLSQERAKSVVNYMDSSGIETERMVPKGYGERMLVNNCACEPNNVGPGAKCSEEEHQLNRRTTFKVIRNDYESKKKEEPKQEEPVDDGLDDEEEDE